MMTLDEAITFVGRQREYYADMAARAGTMEEDDVYALLRDRQAGIAAHLEAYRAMLGRLRKRKGASGAR